ncbi:hypothetical protein K3757_03075 [Sulfitobacter sp. S223]|uniref:hypothetical protein n=1 Tax=Sulfitobacter sp. S223 TaxID=2867023 RepID=UPI0021A5B47F|nr:hypothetical protein [Sulfitobacter sp. S223]UWR26933.1 hypothetical protein K3757_03075 [Sulfitobacter sp. S223]
MVLSPVFIDVLRAAHLVLFAAGMGTALFHDYRTCRDLHAPIKTSDIRSIEQLHRWIVCAFAGLWGTGLILIYIRTGFDLSTFSPKLWVKVSLMALMTVNALMIAMFVLPVLRRNVGRPMLDLAPRDMVVASQLAIISMFCWSSGMVLGSSAYLKTAPWEVLMPLAVGWFVLCTIGGQVGMMVLRTRVLAVVECPDRRSLDRG